MDKYSLSGINVPPEEFLRPFFALDEKVRLRVFSDKRDSAFSGQKLECILEGYSDISDSLRLHNDQQRGVYFVVNYGGHEDSDIIRINAQFMECDNIPLEEQLDKIKAFSLEPSLIVKTRKSLHCYWLMKNAKKEKFRHIQKRLIAHFGADPSCINESRVFRLPGFYHHKEEPSLRTSTPTFPVKKSMTPGCSRQSRERIILPENASIKTRLVLNLMPAFSIHVTTSPGIMATAARHSIDG